ncbi:MAG: type I-B CRISPR-associated protein Cas5b [Promethearchaeia archaeon]
MKTKKIISFRLWGDYALYKKPWCNREQQSYLIPTKTSLIGMIGAILGYGKKKYLKKIIPEKIQVGIKTRKKIEKELQGYNFMQSANLRSKTKNITNPYRKPPGKGMRSPNRLEMLKNPDYRIYIDLAGDKLHKNLLRHLKEKKYVFPPFLGQANLFGNIGSVKEDKLKIRTPDFVNTVVPSELVEGSKLDGKIYNERMPIKMNADRSAPEFLSIAVKNEKNAEIGIRKSGKYLVGEIINGERVSLF